MSFFNSENIKHFANGHVKNREKNHAGWSPLTPISRQYRLQIIDRPWGIDGCVVNGAHCTIVELQIRNGDLAIASPVLYHVAATAQYTYMQNNVHVLCNMKD